VNSACPALLVTAPASGQGKTSVTAALARKHRDAGRRVRVFKTGPDFLDPMILEAASGQPVYQLDLYMGGEAHCRQLLCQAAQEADLILVEGVMGLYDGAPSSADLARLFGLPLLAVIDAAAMAQTFGALAHGLATWQPGLRLAGVLANRVGSPHHAEMLKVALPPGTAWYGALPRDPAHALPERHLGLVQADEVADLETRLTRLAAALPPEALTLPEPVTFGSPDFAAVASGQQGGRQDRLQGVRIAIAHDAAFAFLYRANLDLLTALGAELTFFSPLAGDPLPDCDACWLPGGYPELHLDALSAHVGLHQALRQHHAAGKPLLAECGGMLFLAETLTDAAGRSADMAGLLPARAVLQTRLAALGLQEIQLPEGALRGHTFHHSRLETSLPILTRARNPNGGEGEAVYRQGRFTASYVHSYFPSNPDAVARLFQ